VRARLRQPTVLATPALAPELQPRATRPLVLEPTPPARLVLSPERQPGESSPGLSAGQCLPVERGRPDRRPRQGQAPEQPRATLAPTLDCLKSASDLSSRQMRLRGRRRFAVDVLSRPRRLSSTGRPTARRRAAAPSE
jgi:hypothetical protein